MAEQGTERPPAPVALVLAGNRHVAFEIHALSVHEAEIVGPLVLALRQRVRVTFAADPEPVQLDAEVVRVDTTDLLRDRVTVRFVAPSAELVTVLHELVKHAPAGSADDEDERVTGRMQRCASGHDVDAPTERRDAKKDRR